MTKAIGTRIAVAVLLGLVLLLAPAALAGKGGKGKPGGGGTTGGSSSLSLVVLNGATEPHYGGQVTFNVSTTATSRPFVQLTCTQNGDVVYTFQAGFFPDYPWTRIYTLSSQSWTGGAANCTAKLVSSDGTRTTTLATLSLLAYA
jgi:hypothetical protein